MNFNTADKSVWYALQRLAAPEMKPLLLFLNKQAEQTKDQLLTAEGVLLHRLQGRAGYISDLLEAVETSSSVLEKMR